jgi:acetyl esterase/lipase
MFSLLLQGCGGLTAVNLVSPDPPLLAQDQVYRASPEARLDIFGPTPAPGKPSAPRPVVIFLFGGGWQDGSREQYRFVASGLVAQGYLTVIPDMRMYPEVTFPAFVEDAATATRWVLANIQAYGGDPGRVFLLGHSSGAHIAALLNYDERYLGADSGGHRHCGFIGLSGPYDFLPLVSPTLQEIFPQPLRRRSQPLAFVGGDEPPALLLHGLLDKTVKPRNSAALEQAVLRAGGEARLKVYDDEEHAQLVLALSSTLDFLVPVLADIDTFIKAQACRAVTQTAGSAQAPR